MLSLCHIKPVSFAVFLEDDSRCRELVFQFVKRHLFGKASGYACLYTTRGFPNTACQLFLFDLAFFLVCPVVQRSLGLYVLLVDIVVVRNELHNLDRADTVPFPHHFPIKAMRVAKKDIRLVGDGL